MCAWVFTAVSSARGRREKGGSMRCYTTILHGTPWRVGFYKVAKPLHEFRSPTRPTRLWALNPSYKIVELHGCTCGSARLVSANVFTRKLGSASCNLCHDLRHSHIHLSLVCVKWHIVSTIPSCSDGMGQKDTDALRSWLCGHVKKLSPGLTGGISVKLVSWSRCKWWDNCANWSAHMNVTCPLNLLVLNCLVPCSREHFCAVVSWLVMILSL